MPAVSPESMAPLLWEGPLSMNHLAPAVTAAAGYRFTVMEPGFGV